MNKSIGHLHNVASKNRKRIIGLMSGTSLDGLDIALCDISGSGRDTILDLRDFKTASYPPQVTADLREIVSVENVSLQQLCLWHASLGDYHAELVLEALREWKIEPGNVDCIASHGQTIYHAPVSHHGQKQMPNATLQIGDGDHIARHTGILTLSDFRQKHTAAGGEGAPMVALTDKMLYASETEPRLLLNIGGIANFTYLPVPDNDHNPLTTDTGPGNTLINSLMQQQFDKAFDEDGTTAGRGTVHPELLKALLEDGFFAEPVPRTTGPERFNLQWVRKHQEEAGINNISDEDMIATLTWLSAQTISDAIKDITADERPKIYLSGGGMYNKQMIQWIEQLMDQPTHSFAEIGFNPDAKEAVCFAVLANEALSGEAFTINPKQGAGRSVNFGKISLPV